MRSNGGRQKETLGGESPHNTVEMREREGDAISNEFRALLTGKQNDKSFILWGQAEFMTLSCELW